MLWQNLNSLRKWRTFGTYPQKQKKYRTSFSKFSQIFQMTYFFLPFDGSENVYRTFIHVNIWLSASKSELFCNIYISKCDFWSSKIWVRTHFGWVKELIKKPSTRVLTGSLKVKKILQVCSTAVQSVWMHQNPFQLILSIAIFPYLPMLTNIAFCFIFEKAPRSNNSRKNNSGSS